MPAISCVLAGARCVHHVAVMTTQKSFHIVAALDFDDTAHPTWLSLVDLLAIPGARASVLHVVPASGSDVRKDAAELSSLIAAGHKHVQDVIAHQLRDETNPLRERIDVFVGLGDPAEQIVQLAVDTEADLIVVGTNEKTGIGRLVLGSVSSEVFRKAPCSVLVARSSHYAGQPKTPEVEPPLAENQPAMTRGTALIRYRSTPFSTYSASLFPTGIPRKQVR